MLPQIELFEPAQDHPAYQWALININEDPNERLDKIQQLRDMIYERGECQPISTDDEVLMRFLRARRFIVKMAHRLYVNYCQFVADNPQYFHTEIDLGVMQQIGATDIFHLPTYRDANERRLLIFRLQPWNPNEYDVGQLFRTVIFMAQIATLEPKHQIYGCTVIIDVDRLSMTHAWQLTPTVIRHMLAVGYGALPHRIEAVHILNGGKMFDYAYAMFRPFLNDYVQTKIMLHPTLDSLHQTMCRKSLPKRYGGVHDDNPTYMDWIRMLDDQVIYDKIIELGYRIKK